MFWTPRKKIPATPTFIEHQWSEGVQLLSLRPPKYCDEFVRLSVCLSARISRKPDGRSSPNFLCILPVARSFSGGVAIRYVLPVYSSARWAVMCIPKRSEDNVTVETAASISKKFCSKIKTVTCNHSALAPHPIFLSVCFVSLLFRRFSIHHSQRRQNFDTC